MMVVSNVLFIIILTIISVIFAISIHKQDKCLLPVSKSSTKDLFMHSAISSDAIPCASISNNIMSIKGGNAIDGTIAGLLCTCSVNFHSCGIGGGSFLIFYNKTKKEAFAYDFREIAPGLASENMFSNNISSVRGGKSIAVMGLISGYYEIHRQFGKLEWKTLFEPTINLLTTGFYISQSLETAIKYFFQTTSASEFKELRNLLTDSTTGKPKKFGDKIKLSKLAKTMEILSVEPYAMKNGSLVDKMIAEITAEGGIISKDDLAKYETKIRKPVSVKLDKGKTLYTLPPPSSGALVAFSLNVLQNYEFDPAFLNNCENSGLFFHRLIETMKFSFAKRSGLGDMDFVNVSTLLNQLTSKSYSKLIKSLITDDVTHSISYYGPSFEMKEDHGTSHFSLISPDGDAVSVTSTINYVFGSLIMGKETGIIYNDEMDDFSSPNQTNVYHFKPSKNNFIQPYKRPMSSISPIIIVDQTGNVELVLGSSGGSRILSSIVQIVALSELFDKNIKSSIDAPRVHNQLEPDEVYVENNFPQHIIKSLKKRGHKLKVADKHLAVSQGIKRSSENFQFWECNADFRKMGLCNGS